MPILENKTKNKILIKELKSAQSLWSRMKGLLGTTSIEDTEGLWIHRCDSIHTFFMNYAIDCVFVNKNLEVVSIHRNVEPGRLIWPQKKANSVFELKGGITDKLDLEIGDQLYVGP